MSSDVVEPGKSAQTDACRLCRQRFEGWVRGELSPGDHLKVERHQHTPISPQTTTAPTVKSATTSAVARSSRVASTTTRPAVPADSATSEAPTTSAPPVTTLSITTTVPVTTAFRPTVPSPTRTTPVVPTATTTRQRRHLPIPNRPPRSPDDHAVSSYRTVNHRADDHRADDHRADDHRAAAANNGADHRTCHYNDLAANYRLTAEYDNRDRSVAFCGARRKRLTLRPIENGRR
jgi:hypothetical protein